MDTLHACMIALIETWMRERNGGLMGGRINKMIDAWIDQTLTS